MIDRCVVCGEIVPEGRMVCPKCEKDETTENGYIERFMFSVQLEYEKIPVQEVPDYTLEVSPHDYCLMHKVYCVRTPTETIYKARVFGMNVEICLSLSAGEFRVARKVRTFLAPPWR